jgi:hypothetical protein
VRWTFLGLDKGLIWRGNFPAGRGIRFQKDEFPRKKIGRERIKVLDESDMERVKDGPVSVVPQAVSFRMGSIAYHSAWS